MPPQETAQATVDLYQIFNELLPFFITAGSVFATYAAFGKWLKAWIIKGLIDKEWLESYLNDPEKGIITLMKKEHDDELEKLKKHYRDKFKGVAEHIDKEIKEVKEEHVEKNTKWLRELQPQVQELGNKLSGLQEAINGIRERMREG
jgi:hypothetical protein